MLSNFDSIVINDENHIKSISRKFKNHDKGMQSIIFSKPNNCYLINSNMDSFEAKKILMDAIKEVKDKVYLLLEKNSTNSKLIQEILIVGFQMEKKLLNFAKQSFYAFKYEKNNEFEEVDF